MYFCLSKHTVLLVNKVVVVVVAAAAAAAAAAVAATVVTMLPRVRHPSRSPIQTCV